jgi:hypothetical protein
MLVSFFLLSNLEKVSNAMMLMSNNLPFAMGECKSVRKLKQD